MSSVGNEEPPTSLRKRCTKPTGMGNSELLSGCEKLVETWELFGIFRESCCDCSMLLILFLQSSVLTEIARNPG
jgi:hypothetical protein